MKDALIRIAEALERIADLLEQASINETEPDKRLIICKNTGIDVT